jgi:hypothetical protein
MSEVRATGSGWKEKFLSQLERAFPVARDSRVRLCPVCCFIVPPGVLKKYSRDKGFDDATRKALQDTHLETERLRGLREAHRVATIGDPERFVAELARHVPQQHLFDCSHRKNLPGKAVATPAGGFKTTFDTTAKLVAFYKTVLGRNSVDSTKSKLRWRRHEHSRAAPGDRVDGRRLAFSAFSAGQAGSGAGGSSSGNWSPADGHAPWRHSIHAHGAARTSPG